MPTDNSINNSINNSQEWIRKQLFLDMLVLLISGNNSNIPLTALRVALKNDNNDMIASLKNQIARTILKHFLNKMPPTIKNKQHWYLRLCP